MHKKPCLSEVFLYYQILIMQAIVLEDFGSVDQLKFTELTLPVLKPGEVLVQTRAISINPVDIKTRKGKGQAARLKEDPPMILGWDISGKVVDSGDSSLFNPGDEVFGMINIPGHGKAYAEFVAANVEHLARKPASLDHQEAAASCLAAMTAMQALLSQANLQKGQRILIHAASGGVGHFAVQIAKHIGAHVIATSSSANRDFILSLGADQHVDYKAGPLTDQVSEVDVVLDAIGGDNIPLSLAVLKKGGTIVSLPSGISESVGEQAAAQGKKGIFFFVKSGSKDMQQIAQWLDEKIIRAHIDNVYSFSEIKRAHEHVESGRTVGKVVIAL